jgi:hypothetical protein
MNKNEQGWAWWLTPVILATWKVQFERIVVEDEPGQKVSEAPSQLIIWELAVGRLQSTVGQARTQDPT